MDLGLLSDLLGLLPDLFDAVLDLGSLLDLLDLGSMFFLGLGVLLYLFIIHSFTACDVLLWY